MQLGEIKTEIASIVRHENQCDSRRHTNPGECSCRHPQTVEKLNELFIHLLKGRR